jgi:hypothetical protein
MISFRCVFALNGSLRQTRWLYTVLRFAWTHVDIATTPHGLEITLTATLGIPFLVLVVDYVFRTDTGILRTMRNSGPDLCLLGLGSVGSVFLDQK